ncbi:immune inhibitor A domain-containing protein [Shewanella acanthi]|uniref:immune inhibitor A domain-containing protein n=1 Tax=Shewanella acanthi TaxID=2864212 RepID=UPI001C66219B|nr:immune inhibitor A domain-containing protein [Shewanella acanthi]QYJ78963.1 immune inhibitor A [Shewanella acanthi]
MGCKAKNSVIGYGLFLSFLCSVCYAESSSAPVDVGVINKERILYWLTERGEVAADANESAKQAAVEAYIQRAHRQQLKMPRLVVEAEHRRLSKIKPTKKMLAPSSAQLVDADIKTTVKVLSVLIDFPNLRHNNNGLTASDTNMYYSSYPASHYQGLLFSTTGFEGPQGQTLDSVYQYYQAVSGQTFTFSGTVKGWYTSSQNAEYYGANDGEVGSDTLVTELVKEALSQAVLSMSASELATYDVEDPYDLNNNGNYEEPDGILDHVMIFHSSIGEEAGGGKLGADAIWSHRYFVDQETEGYSIPGTNLKLFGYTIQPIDAATGVCTHEFGHDLGLPDEYDTSFNSDQDGSPVGQWSLMSSGSWAGNIPGSKPSGFSPYARSYLQEKFKGKWLNEREIGLETIPKSGMTVTLNQASDQEVVNQVSIPLPGAPISFKKPYQGSYQYYSDQGNMLNNRMEFNVTLPAAGADKILLNMKASWAIETDYDYMQVKVDQTAIRGNFTKSSNIRNSAKHILTGNSSSITGAEGADKWVNLIYDLSAYAGQSVTIEFNYVTDEGWIESGIVLDNINIMQGTTVIFADDAETKDTITLDGFSRITDQRPGAKSRYIIQLRSHNGVDAGLQYEGYEPGVLMWLENFGFYDNNSSEHPGYGLIGVIDADQNLIGNRSTEIQIRDAAFSTVRQSAYNGDSNLNAVSLFDDSFDYSAPLQPQSGMVLQELGLSMEVLSQASDNSTAMIRLVNSSADSGATALSAAIDSSKANLTLTVSAIAEGGQSGYRYLWDFGDGSTSTSMSATHTYANSGSYTVTLTVTDAAGATATTSVAVTFVSSATTGADISDSGGSGGGGLSLLCLGLLGAVGWRRQRRAA